MKFVRVLLPVFACASSVWGCRTPSSDSMIASSVDFAAPAKISCRTVDELPLAPRGNGYLHLYARAATPKGPLLQTYVRPSSTTAKNVKVFSAYRPEETELQQLANDVLKLVVKGDPTQGCNYNVHFQGPLVGKFTADVRAVCAEGFGVEPFTLECRATAPRPERPTRPSDPTLDAPVSGEIDAIANELGGFTFGVSTTEPVLGDDAGAMLRDYYLQLGGDEESLEVVNHPESLPGVDDGVSTIGLTSFDQAANAFISYAQEKASSASEDGEGELSDADAKRIKDLFKKLESAGAHVGYHGGGGGSVCGATWPTIVILDTAKRAASDFQFIAGEC